MLHAIHHNIRRKTIAGFALLCLCVFSFSSAWAQGQQHTSFITLNLTCTVPPNSIAAKHLFNLYEKAFKPLGYSVNFVHVDSKRAVELLMSKQVDGTCGRDKNFSAITGIHHLIPLEFSSGNAKLYAIKQANRDANIRKDSTRIGFLPLFQVAAKNLQKMNYKKTIPYPNALSLLDAISRGEVDLGIVADTFYIDYLKNNPNSNLMIHEVFMTQPAFLHLTDTHRRLIKPFSRRLEIAASESVNYRTRIKNAAKGTDHIPTLTFGCALKPGDINHQRFVETATKALSAIGYSIKTIQLSRLREHIELEKGNIDGACARGLHFINNMSHNSVKLNIPIASGSIDVMSRNAHRKITKAQDITTEERVGLIKGTYTIDPLLEQQNLTLKYVSNTKQGLEWLSSGKIDLYIDFKYSIIEAIGESSLPHRLYTAGHIAKPVLYPVLHKKHSHLAKPLEAEFTKLLATQKHHKLLEY